jgi:hypothetical protein
VNCACFADVGVVERMAWAATGAGSAADWPGGGAPADVAAGAQAASEASSAAAA